MSLRSRRFQQSVNTEPCLVCACGLKTPSVVCTVESLPVGFMAHTLWQVLEQSLSDTSVFSLRPISAFRWRRTVGRTAAPWPGAFKTESHPQRAQKGEKRATETTKKSLVYNIRAEQAGRAVPFLTPVGNASVHRWLRVFTALLVSVLSDRCEG